MLYNVYKWLCVGVVIIIKIDTSKIKNWDKIKERHWRYVKEKVLTKINENTDSIIIFLITGEKKYRKDKVEECLKNIAIERRDSWKIVKHRYDIYEKVVEIKINNKYSANIYDIVNKFYYSTSDKESIIKNLQKDYSETDENKKFYKDISNAINTIIMDEKKIGDKDKMSVLESIGLAQYKRFINLKKEMNTLFKYNDFCRVDVKSCSKCEGEVITNLMSNNIEGLVKDIESNKDIVYILTREKEVAENKIRESIRTILEKKEDLGIFKDRYDEKLFVVNKFLSTKKRKPESIIKDIKSQLQEKSIEEDEILENIIGKLNEDIKSTSIADRKKIIYELGYGYKIEAKEILDVIFNYNKFRSWNRHEFLTMLGVEICPYCNRQYITSYDDDIDKKTTADLDHYYPKSKYPFLALSLYNFIPSCQICNSRFKGDKTEETMYPYEESFDDEDVQYKFETSIKGDVRYLIGEDKDFTLSINKRKDKYRTNKLERANNSNEIFKLDKVYQSHKGYVEELFEKAYKYNEVWRDDINDIFKNEDSLFIDKKELFEFAFGKNLTPEEYSKRPLAKLTRDILDELGIEVE